MPPHEMRCRGCFNSLSQPVLRVYKETNLAKDMRTILKHPLGTLLSLLFLCSCATQNPTRSPLPADAPMNKGAGRGDLLIVTLRLESGEALPMLVDTGASGTMIDKSLEPKLGTVRGTATIQSWGVKEEKNVYATPKLYLGRTRLLTGDNIVTDDFKKLSADAGHPIMGILGMDVLEHYCIQLDFAAGEVRFLDDERADKKKWGKAFPIQALNPQDARPSVCENLFGAQGPHSLIDTGCNYDGWLMPKWFQQWTNQTKVSANGEVRPNGALGGETYPRLDLHEINVESDGIGLHFLSRHLVTLDFPKWTLYLQRQSVGPLPSLNFKSTRMEALDLMIKAVIQEDVAAARAEEVRIEKSGAPALTKLVARKLMATLENEPKPAPCDVAPEVARLALGDARPELAEVGWLKPLANRIPLNGEVESPLLDSGKIYATGLFAHAPSRYVYNLGGKWKSLRGAAGLHTAFQPYGSVVFSIKTDGTEVFRSPGIHGPAQAGYEVDVTGVKTLELIVDKAGSRNGGNWGLWLDPTLLRKPLAGANGQ